MFSPVRFNLKDIVISKFGSLNTFFDQGPKFLFTNLAIFIRIESLDHFLYILVIDLFLQIHFSKHIS